MRRRWRTAGPCVTGGPSGRDDLSKSRRDLLRGPAEHAVTCGTSDSPSRDEEIRAADQMAPQPTRVGSGRLKPRTLNVADRTTMALRLAAEKQGAAGARLFYLRASRIGFNAICQRGPFHRCMKPSVSVCMKLTSAFSSSSESPSRPTNFVFMLSVDSGGGQHVVPSPASLVPQRCRTSRVL